MSTRTHPVGSARDERVHSVRLRAAARWSPTAQPATGDVDLRQDVPTHAWTVFDQRTLNSCTANALSSAIQFELLRADATAAFVPSRLFLWYQARKREHEAADNEPVYLSDDVKALLEFGVCAEEPSSVVPRDAVWPYDVRAFARRPPQPCYDFAGTRRTFRAVHLEQDLDHLLARLAAGHPFTINVAMFPAMQPPACYGPDFPELSAMDLPPGRAALASAANAVGWHTMLVHGCDPERRRFHLRNSMGSGWGDGGDGTIPFDYVTNPALCDSLWSLELVTG